LMVYTLNDPQQRHQANGGVEMAGSY